MIRGLPSLVKLQRHLSHLPSSSRTACEPFHFIPLRQSTSLTSNYVPPSSPSTEQTSLSTSLSSLAEQQQQPQQQPVPYRRGLTIRHLLDARVHMGHRRHLWNPRMSPYIYGHRNGMHVIDLDKTLIMLRRALQVVSRMAEDGCTFLWLGPRDTQRHRLMQKIAKDAQVYTLGGRWVGGTLTNALESGQAEKLGYRLPDCLFVVDTLRHAPALREAKRMGIPTIGVVDSDCDPTQVTYAIPGNDDGAHALNLYFQLMRLAVQEGRAVASKRNIHSRNWRERDDSNFSRGAT